jgi:hypothetical protein
VTLSGLAGGEYLLLLAEFNTPVMQCCGLKASISLIDNDVLEKLNNFDLKIP